LLSIEGRGPMRINNNIGGGFVYSMPFVLIVLFGCMALPGSPELLKVGDMATYPKARTNTSSNDVMIHKTFADESKISFKFCDEYTCNGTRCYCCLIQKPEALCYLTKDKCLAICPACNPKCPPESLPQTTKLDRVAMVNGTLQM
ncbi:hypothetical protein EJB05_30874, partial [Eragrostis curvula]